MKFKVKKTDFIIFITFCIFLLYLSAIAVLNVTSLINEGRFFGDDFIYSIIPIRAFFPPYLGPTLIIFFTFLITIFMSVKSYIFGKDKGSGLGFSFSKKESDGYARWAEEKEVKNAPKVSKILIEDSSIKAGGVPLINDGKEMWVDTGENHSIVIGATASGKTTTIVDPLVMNLAKAGESIVLTDPKAELYERHANMLKNMGYNVIVLNFREPQKGNSWNPLTLPYKLYKEGNLDKSKELLEDVALNILYDESNQGEPFWEKSAADYFGGLALGLFEDAKDEEEVNINSINYMSTVGEESFGIQSNYIKSYFELKGKNSAPYVFSSATINAPEATKSSILSVFRQKIRQFSTGGALSEMLSYSDFNMKDIGKHRTAVFLVVHDEKKTYHSLATIFIKQCYEALIDVAHANGGELKYRTNFILDEFANMPPLQDVTTMVTAARSRKIRFNFIIQNFAQLNQVYDKETAETIRSNCGNLIYLITTELAALEELSKLFGEVKEKGKDGKPDTVKPLVSISDLQKLKLNEVIILRSRLSPFKTKLTPSYEINWGYNYEKADFNIRPKNDVKIFDIQEFVKAERKKQLFDMQTKEAEKNKNNVTSEIISNKKPTEVNVFNPLNQSNKNIESLLSGMNSQSPVSEEALKEAEELLSGSYSTDDLISKIDKRIEELTNEINEMAEIEKPAENKTKEPKVKAQKEEDYDILEQTIYENFNDFLLQSEEEKPEVLVDEEIKEVNKPSVTDDQYYDDFF